MKKKIFLDFFPKNNSGFSIIEVVVSLSILIFLISALFGIYFQFGKLYSLGQASNIATDATRQGLNGLVAYTAQASKVAPNHIYDGVNYTTGSSTLVLQIPAVDINGNVITDNFDFVIYYASSSVFYRIVDPAVTSARQSSNKILASSITSLNFEFNSNVLASTTAITADIVAVSRYDRITSTSSARDTMILRNFSP